MLTIGYVVGVHNTLNFDVDIPDQMVNKLYEKMLENKHSCKRPEPKAYQFYDTPSYDKIDITKMNEYSKNVVTGNHYRCRISNIEANHDRIKRDSRAQKIWTKTYGRIRSLLNLSHNWVVVKLHSIDRFGRITISLYDIITGHPYAQEYLSDKTEVFKRHNATKT